MKDKLIDLLIRLGEYMDSRSDILEVGENQGQQIPNEEMRFQIEIDEMISSLTVPST